jgi:hypothetical protein
MQSILRLSTLMLITIGAVGCGDSDSSSATAPPATPSTTTGSGSSGTGSTGTITLTGSPPTAVMAGAGYTFEPTVVGNASGVVFSISGQPAWAQFNAKNGSLKGTPKTTDEGTTGHITITAKNAGNTASMTPFTIRVMAPTGNSSGAELTWTAPTENTDGSPVTGLAGYRIYYGSSAEEMTNIITVSGSTSTSYQLAGLAEGTYYFSIVAYNLAGLESGVSSVIDQKI